MERYIMIGEMVLDTLTGIFEAVTEDTVKVESIPEVQCPF